MIKCLKKVKRGNRKFPCESRRAIVVVVLLFYVHGKYLRSCRDGQLI